MLQHGRDRSFLNGCGCGITLLGQRT
jgi:hypothetical protein